MAATLAKAGCTSKTSFIYGPEGVFATRERNGDQTYLHKDHLGTPRALTDGNGNLMGRHDYYAFGSEIPRSNQADEPTKKYTGHERDPHGLADYMLGRTYLYPFMRFATPDVARDGWNLYGYTGNNPVNRVDPDGEAVYLVTYTTGNSSGDTEFRRAAETRAHELRSQEGFDPEKDTVLVRGVKTKEDFTGAVSEANALEEPFGKVQELSLFSHSGFIAGPVFHTESGESTQFSNQELGELNVNWSAGGCGRFYGCRTAANFTQRFASAQGVAAYGYEGFASFSSSPGLRSSIKSNGSLYLIDAPSRSNDGLTGWLQYQFGRARATGMTLKLPPPSPRKPN